MQLRQASTINYPFGQFVCIMAKPSIIVSSVSVQFTTLVIPATQKSDKSETDRFSTEELLIVAEVQQTGYHGCGYVRSYTRTRYVTLCFCQFFLRILGRQDVPQGMCQGLQIAILTFAFSKRS